MAQPHDFLKDSKAKKCDKCMLKIGMFDKAFMCRNCKVACCKKCIERPDVINSCKVEFPVAAAQPDIPQDPVMEFYVKYVKRDKDGKMVVRGLPQEWKNLFKDAGVKPSELKNPDTARWLIGLMNDVLSGNISANVPDADGTAVSAAPTTTTTAEFNFVCKVEALYDFHAQEVGDLSFKKGDIIDVIERFPNGWATGYFKGQQGSFPFNYVKELPPEPSFPPPAPPVMTMHESAPSPSQALDVVEDVPIAKPPVPASKPPSLANVVPAAPTPPPAPVVAVSAPAAPPPPAPPAAPTPPPVPSGGGGGGASGIMAGSLASAAANLKKAPERVVEKPEGRGGLLADIQKGGHLRHVDTETQLGKKKELSELTGGERSNLLNILNSAISQRRLDLKQEIEDEGEEGWDDWD